MAFATWYDTGNVADNGDLLPIYGTEKAEFLDEGTFQRLVLEMIKNSTRAQLLLSCP